MPSYSKSGASGPELTKRFAVNLTRLREHRGLNKSELAKELFGTETDSRGYTVARNRDRIGSWESAKSRPTPDNLLLLADFFRLDPAVMAPDLVGADASRAPQAASMRVLEATPDKAHIELNVVLPVTLAAKVMALVASGASGDDADK